MKHQPNNGILIKEFDGDAYDQELINLIPFLKHLEQVYYSIPMSFINLLCIDLVWRRAASL